MSVDEMYEKCEVVEQERQEEEDKKKFRQQHAGYREAIDGFLAREAYDELLDYYQTEPVKKLCLMENDVAIVNIVLVIYQDELANGSEKKILTGIHSMREARERYLRAKFVMWRLEFFDEKDVFLELLEKHPVSPYFLMHLIYTSSFEKGDTAIKMTMILKESGRFAQAFAILNFLNQLCPDEEAIYCEMAEVCILAGQIESANACIQRIKNPSGILAEYRKKWGM